MLLFNISTDFGCSMIGVRIYIFWFESFVFFSCVFLLLVSLFAFVSFGMFSLSLNRVALVSLVIAFFYKPIFEHWTDKTIVCSIVKLRFIQLPNPYRKISTKTTNTHTQIHIYSCYNWLEQIEISQDRWRDTFYRVTARWLNFITV